MKKSMPLICALCLVLGITACCGSTEKDTAEEFSVQSGTPYGCPVDFDKDSLPAAFANAIENYCRNGTFPDGQSGDIPSRISYAVCDIDGDGQDELIMQDTRTITASMTERIYHYENGVFREILCEYPSLTYYDNGIIQAEYPTIRAWPETDSGPIPCTDISRRPTAMRSWDPWMHGIGNGRTLPTMGARSRKKLTPTGMGVYIFFCPLTGKVNTAAPAWWTARTMRTGGVNI